MEDCSSYFQNGIHKKSMENMVIARSEGCSHVCVDENMLSRSLVIKRLKEKLESLSPSFPECSIYRVPEKLRGGNERAFTPQLISIGPLHYSNDKLKDMEEHKMRFLKDFLSRAKVSLDDCLQLVNKKLVQLRNCYADSMEFESDKFIEIILVDTAFIVEVFLRSRSGKKRQNQDDNYYNFFGRGKLRIIKYDMLLLENQVPFFIFEDLLSLIGSANIPIENDVRRSAIRLTFEFFRSRLTYDYGLVYNDLSEEKLCQSNVQHFVDFVRLCHLPPEMPCKSRLKSLTIPTVTHLHQAGIRFKAKTSGSVFDIQFKDGVLEIPSLRIYDATEGILRNLLAYEHCHLGETYVSDYVFIMDRLIDTPGDVDLLIHNGIIESKLADSQEVASLINKLSPGVALSRANFNFTNLCEDLNDYYRVPWHKWRTTLKRDYFSNPWTIISVIAAVVLLILTFVQTFYSVVSYYK